MPPIVKASGPRNAKIAVVGMAPAFNEVVLGKPFMGPSGKILDDALRKNGIDRRDVYVTNIHESPLPSGGSNFDLPTSVQAEDVQRLRLELETVNPNVIIPLGDEPLSIICGRSSISKWRGSILETTIVKGKKAVPSYHPAFILRGMFKWNGIFTHIDIKRAIEESSDPTISLPKREIIIRPNLQTVREFARECEANQYLSFDIEGYYSQYIRCVGIGWKHDLALCIPFTYGTGQSYWNPTEEREVWLIIARLLQNTKLKKVAQNASYEWLNFWKHNIFPQNLWIDTMLAHHCLYPDYGGTEQTWIKRKRDPGLPGHGLAFINSCYTRTPFYKDDGREWIPSMGDDIFWRYNGYDVTCTLEAALKMEKELHEENLWDYYHEFYLRSFEKTIKLEWEGISFDSELAKEIKADCESELIRLRDSKFKELGYELNVSSTKQMQNFLYNVRKYPIHYKQRKGGKKTITVDKEVIAEFILKHPEDPILSAIAEEKKIEDFISDILEQQVDSNGRIHCHWKLGGTDGSRWSSTKSILGSGTNFQNLPRPTKRPDGTWEVRSNARKLFLPEDRIRNGSS